MNQIPNKTIETYLQALLLTGARRNKLAEGPMSTPSDFDDFYWEDIDITKDISDDIAQALIEENSEFKEKLVAFNGEEEYLKIIKHKKLKQVMTKTWKKNKHYWV